MQRDDPFKVTSQFTKHVHKTQSPAALIIHQTATQMRDKSQHSTSSIIQRLCSCNQRTKCVFKINKYPAVSFITTQNTTKSKCATVLKSKAKLWQGCEDSCSCIPWIKDQFMVSILKTVPQLEDYVNKTLLKHETLKGKRKSLVISWVVDENISKL